MSDTAWLRKVLDDAKAAKQQWPEWAKDRPAKQKQLTAEQAADAIVKQFGKSLKVLAD